MAAGRPVNSTSLPMPASRLQSSDPSHAPAKSAPIRACLGCSDKSIIPAILINDQTMMTKPSVIARFYVSRFSAFWFFAFAAFLGLISPAVH